MALFRKKLRGGVIQGKRDDDLVPALLAAGCRISSLEQAQAMGLTDRFTAKMLEREGDSDGRPQEPQAPGSAAHGAEAHRVRWPHEG
jgi:hypothetical protein